MVYDLHVHTTDSDGIYSRLELLEKAHKLGMQYISFTDHDYISHEDVALKYKTKYGKCDVEIIEGTEFTVSDYNYMHILGYDIKKTKIINDALEKIKNQNIQLCNRLIKNLNDYYNMNLDLEKYSQYRVTKSLVRKMIIDNGYASNYLEAGELYTGPNSKFYEKTLALNLDTIIDLVKKSDGLLVLAHPITLGLDNDTLDRLIFKLVEKGLDGIEIYNASKNALNQIKYYTDLASKYNLLTSCGSDFHEDRHTLGISNNMSNKLIKLIKER